MKSWQVWVKGLIAAVVSAAANSISLMIASPATFNFSNGGLRNLGTVTLASALVGAALYLKQSPVPK